MVAQMNFWSWLENLLKTFRGFPSVPSVAVPVVPVAPVVSPVPITPPSPNVILPRASSPTPVVPPVIVPKPVSPPFVASPKPSFEPVFGRGSFGLMHTHNSAKSVSQDSVNSLARVQAAHIMAFGASNPWPNENGPLNWGAIDWAINRVKGAKTPLIVLYGAPAWMKNGADYSETRVRREKFPAFAKLCQEVAMRYTWCKTFVVWNEFKGFWGSQNRWNFEEYTEMYNLVYDAIKAVRPDVRVGGPYMVLDAYADANQSSPSNTWRGAWGVGDQRVQDAYTYWQRHARGFDFVAFDFGPNNRGTDSKFTDARCLDKMLDFMKWIRTWSDKPIISMETYLDPRGGSSMQQTRELWVSLLKRMRSEISGESAALIWDEKGFRPSLDPELVSVLSRFQVLES
jgi:hypothetical protein